MVMLSPGSGGLSSPKQRCPVPGHILHWCWQQQGILHRDPHPSLGPWGKPPPGPGRPLPPASPCPQLTLKPMSPFLQHRQANMRKMKVKSPEKETATTASEEDQESSLRGVPSAGTGGVWAQGGGHQGGMWLCPGVLLGVGHGMQGHIRGLRREQPGRGESQHCCAPFAGSSVGQDGWGAQEGPQSRGRTPPAAGMDGDRHSPRGNAGWQ